MPLKRYDNIEEITNIQVRAFVSKGRHRFDGMNILGLSPGPPNLSDYMFFYQFQNVTGITPKQLKIQVGMLPGRTEDYDNWKYDSHLHINDH